VRGGGATIAQICIVLAYILDRLDTLEGGDS
jgi:hypothetical protein